MIESMKIITNNPRAKKQFEEKYEFQFVEGTVMDVFRTVRDHVHGGHRLLTHPLVSSIKPNEIPYRTVILTEKKEKSVDLWSLSLIEDAVNITAKFLRDFPIPDWSESVLEDFQVIDCDLINQGINK